MGANIDPRMREYILDRGARIESGGMIILTGKQWKREPYTGTSIRDGSVRTWMIPSVHGCCLLFEGKHFRIEH